MTSVSAGHIILTPTQPVGSGRPQRESNPGLPDQESHALPTELPRPPRERERGGGEEREGEREEGVCLFGCFLNALVKNQAISRTGPMTDF